MRKSRSLILLCSAVCLAALPSRVLAESVGLNFSVEGHPETELAPEDYAGLADVAQVHWNNLPGSKNGKSPLLDDTGKSLSSLSAEWTVPRDDTLWRSKVAKSWGFKDGNKKLQSGYIQLGGSLSVSGIPYPKYDVYVYLGAADSGGKGRVSISAPGGGVDPHESYYYEFGWLDGKFSPSEATSEEDIKPGNLVVFSGNTAKDFTLDWKGDLGGGWTGVTGVQIVATP